MIISFLKRELLKGIDWNLLSPNIEPEMQYIYVQLTCIWVKSADACLYNNYRKKNFVVGIVLGLYVY